MNVHLARRLVVDREADRAHLDRRKTNRQFAGSRQAGEFGGLRGLARTDQITFRGRAVSYLGRSADEFGTFRLESLLCGSDGRSGSGEAQQMSHQKNPEWSLHLFSHKQVRFDIATTWLSCSR